eukprot:CAMPEP_0183349620 /NCGR_PEP_ID=MMETSP0164_2-20130417/13745_1 /TAXON_ID=221442 /ORGANISM="Coccolithus pelagicus ssp braarudi, Strain PLY182g" /LENGTH=46 /DNA_ID= /DNA_START= /DNA_END= /DNA_ORIENTATION=
MTWLTFEFPAMIATPSSGIDTLEGVSGGAGGGDGDGGGGEGDGDGG